MEFVKEYVKSEKNDTVLSIMWMAPENPHAILQILHGKSEHKERYEEMMQFFAQRGFAVIIHDMQGHGESVVSQEDLGYMYEGGIDLILSDARMITHFARRKWGEKPLYLFGHSMGSLLARIYIARYDYDIEGVILCGPPYENKAAYVGKLLVKGLMKKHGSRYQMDYVKNLATGAYEKAFEEGVIAWLSVNKENQENFKQCPLCGIEFTLDAYNTLFDLMHHAFMPSHYEKTNLALPLLFLAGGDDPCAGGEEHFRETICFYRKLGYTDIYQKLYDGYRHEIMNEDIKEEMFQDMYKWLRYAARK